MDELTATAVFQPPQHAVLPYPLGPCPLHENFGATNLNFLPKEFLPEMDLFSR